MITFQEFDRIFKHFNEGVYLVDKNRKILYYNEAAEHFSGFDRHYVMGHHCHDNLFNHMSEDGTLLCFEGCPLNRSIVENIETENCVYLRHKDGFRLKVHAKTMPILENGEVIGVLEVFSPVIPQEDHSQTIHYYKQQLLMDPLTKVHNRKILETGNPVLDIDKNEMERMGVIFIDIDNFKTYNDTYGHQLGDFILVNIAKTLSNAVGLNDLVIRYGGEEFVILTPDSTKEKVETLANKVQMLIDKTEIEKDGILLNYKVSLGVTLRHYKESLVQTIDRADQAMYKSKYMGKNRITYID